MCRFHWASRSYSGVTRGSIADRTISRDVVAVLSVTCGQLHRPGYTGLPWMESRKPRSAYDRFPESIPYPIVLCSLSVLFGLAIPAHSLRHFNSSNVLGRILFSARRDCRLDESYANTNQLDTRKKLVWLPFCGHFEPWLDVRASRSTRHNGVDQGFQPFALVPRLLVRRGT